MHPNQIFRKSSTDLNIEFATRRSFGTLAINGENGPLLSHVPFQLSADGAYLEAHLVRSNPVLKMLDAPVSCVIAISGGDSYISPDWYEIDDQVPTWNYVAVHIRGQLRRLPDDDLLGILQRLSKQFESRLAPKPEWKVDKLEPKTYARFKRMIVPIAMDVTEIEGTWKLAQNKPEAVRIAAANKVVEAGIGQQLEELAELMRDPPC